MLELIAIIFQFRAIAIVMYLKLENAFNKKKKHIMNHSPTLMKAQFLPLFNVNLSQLQLNSTLTQFQLNFH